MKNALKNICLEENTAKKYLKQIEKYKLMIDAKCNQLKELEKYSNLIGCNNISSAYSSSNKITSKTENIASKRTDLKMYIEDEIHKYTLLKNNIIDDIYKTNDNRYINVLLTKYVEIRSLEETSVKLGYSYEYTRHLHLRALKKVYEIIKK